MERKAFQIRTALGGSLERPQGGATWLAAWSPDEYDQPLPVGFQALSWFQSYGGVSLF